MYVSKVTGGLFPAGTSVSEHTAVKHKTRPFSGAGGGCRGDCRVSDPPERRAAPGDPPQPRCSPIPQGRMSAPAPAAVPAAVPAPVPPPRSLRWQSARQKVSLEGLCALPARVEGLCPGGGMLRGVCDLPRTSFPKPPGLGVRCGPGCPAAMSAGHEASHPPGTTAGPSHGCGTRTPGVMAAPW